MRSPSILAYQRLLQLIQAAGADTNTAERAAQKSVGGRSRSEDAPIPGPRCADLQRRDAFAHLHSFRSSAPSGVTGASRS